MKKNVETKIAFGHFGISYSVAILDMLQSFWWMIKEFVTGQVKCIFTI